MISQYDNSWHDAKILRIMYPKKQEWKVIETMDSCLMVAAPSRFSGSRESGFFFPSRK